MQTSHGGGRRSSERLHQVVQRQDEVRQCDDTKPPSPSFHFLTDAADRAAYRAALTAGVKRGGRVIIGTFAPDGPEKCSGLPVMRYSPASLAAELGDGFRLVDSLTEAHRTPAGSVQHFQFSVFERP